MTHFKCQEEGNLLHINSDSNPIILLKESSALTTNTSILAALLNDGKFTGEHCPCLLKKSLSLFSVNNFPRDVKAGKNTPFSLFQNLLLNNWYLVILSLKCYS